MRTLNTRFKRLLRLRDFEFFKVVVSDDERDAYLLIYDERSQGASQEENHVKVFLISNFELSESSYQDVLSFNDDLLGMKYKCSYFMDTLSVKEEFDFDFPFNMIAIRDYIQEILPVLGISKGLPDFEELDFNYLSQEK